MGADSKPYTFKKTCNKCNKELTFARRDYYRSLPDAPITEYAPVMISKSCPYCRDALSELFNGETCR